MKIVSNNECYVEQSDIEYLSNSLKNEEEIKIKLETISYKPKEYIKIEDQKLKEFINSSSFIIPFEFLYMFSYEKLFKLALRLKIDLIDIENSISEKSVDADIIAYKEKIINIIRKKQYLLNQIEEMINYKKGISEIKYPNIPNPCLEGITSEGLIAKPSIKYGNILVYKENGMPISLKDNPEFYAVAYKLFMHDIYSSDIDNIEIEHILSNDGKYVSIKGIKQAKEENIKLERKL